MPKGVLRVTKKLLYFSTGFDIGGIGEGKIHSNTKIQASARNCGVL
jgi:hypothetical protein